MDELNANGLKKDESQNTEIESLKDRIKALEETDKKHAEDIKVLANILDVDHEELELLKSNVLSDGELARSLIIRGKSKQFRSRAVILHDILKERGIKRITPKNLARALVGHSSSANSCMYLRQMVELNLAKKVGWGEYEII